jgi:hypothetical protein
MTRRLGRGDTQKGRARLALLIVSGITAVLILGLTPGGSLLPLFAAPTGSPTGTATKTAAPANGATPTTGPGPSIRWINPSAYEDPEVLSDKQDANATYHLVASVGNIPPNPDVQFEVYAPTDLVNSVAVVHPVRIGTTDVWEADWPISPPVTDGDYVLRARLITSSATPGTVATDDEEVTIDAGDNGNDIDAAEITYPTNMGPLGTYDPPGSATRGFIVEAKTSPGSTGIVVFYSTSPPGTDPNWRECDDQVTISYSSNERQVGCTAAGNVGPADITAVAAAATGTEAFSPIPEPNCVPTGGPQNLVCPTVDAGDAHRVAAYDQIPTSIGILPFTSNSPVASCRELTATALDQLAVPRPIYRANIDVHAVGPLDGTKFGKSPSTSPYQPPNAGVHDNNESTANCGTAPETEETEGVHIHVNTADEKHIESTTGTDPNGRFVFALRSPDLGNTNVTAFIDKNDDDLGSGDPTGTATVTWGPAASVSGSPTTTISPSTSATSSATATNTATSSATSTSGPASRSISLEPSKSKTKFGKHVTLTGAVSSSSSSCVSGQTVKIQRSTSGGSFADFGTATTTSGGSYSFDFIADENAAYRATVEASPSCGAATSTTRNVLVKVKVKLTASDHKVKKGAIVKFHIHVNPCGNHAGTSVVLVRNTGHGYKQIAEKNVNGNCKATFSIRVKRDANYKAEWPGQDNDHELGTSRRQKVNVTNDGN